MQSNGYATVASSIAQDPDKETYIFCRFDKLTARNLLNLQGELLALQDELDALDAEAAKSPDPDLHSSMRSWKFLAENSKVSQGRTGEEARKRLGIARALEVKLKKYRESARAEYTSTWNIAQVDSKLRVEEPYRLVPTLISRT